MPETQPPRAPDRSSATRSTAMVVGALVVVVAVVTLIVRAGRREPETPAPELSSILIVSIPVGSSVVRADDGGVLGSTPFTASLPRGEGELPVIVKHEGFNDRRVIVPLYSETGRIDVTLTALGADAAPPP